MAGVSGLELEGVLAFPVNLLVHRHRLASDVGPATAAGVLGVTVRVTGERLALALAKQLAEIDSFVGLGFEDLALVGRKAGDLTPPEDDRLLVVVGAPTHARIDGLEFEGAPELVASASHDHGFVARQFASGIARGFERLERLLEGAGIGIAAGGRHEQVRRAQLRARDQQQGGNKEQSGFHQQVGFGVGREWHALRRLEQRAAGRISYTVIPPTAHEAA